MKKVLVLGGTGFIGRNFVEYYANKKDYEVTATYFTRIPWDLTIAKWMRADLRIDDDVNRVINDFDLVIQAAATTSGIRDGVNRPDLHMTDNVVMNAQILRRVNQLKINNFVFFSCTTMLQTSSEPQKETDLDLSLEMHPTYFGVGWTKVYIEKLCEFYARKSSNGTQFHVIRHSNVYGPHDKFDLDRSHVFGASITKVMTAENEVLIWGSGKEKRDLVHVEDLISLVDLAVARQETRFSIYNCGGDFISVRDLVQRIIEVSGRKNVVLKFDETKPTVDFEATLDCSFAISVLGWEKKVSLEEGISRTIKFWKNHHDNYRLG